MRARRSCIVLAIAATASLNVSPALGQSSAVYTYDALGRLLRVTYPNGSYTAYNHDTADNRKVLVMSTTQNNPPVANNDGPINVTAGSNASVSVLANDTDSDGDTKTLTNLVQGTKGNAVISGNSVIYTANAGTSGTDQFVYEISDGHGGVAGALVTMSITAASGNHTPDAVNDSRTTPYGTQLSFDPRTNDTDADGDSLTVTAVGAPAVNTGTTSYSSSSVTYTPAAGFSGSTSFTYTISDGHGGTDTATVSVTVESQQQGSLTATLTSGSYMRNYNPTGPGWDAGSPINVGVQGGTATGGTPPYTYTWSFISGGDTGTSISSTSGVPVTWTRTLSGFSPSPAEYTSTWRLVVTDSAQHSYTVGDVDVTLTKNSCPTC